MQDVNKCESSYMEHTSRQSQPNMVESQIRGPPVGCARGDWRERGTEELSVCGNAPPLALGAALHRCAQRRNLVEGSLYGIPMIS